ncbi:DUF998 domain-containing protein [Nonomuraea diastatica]|uniref:DUF998 domain-containing protein n=1 Tax=Nonomuraea diastatica TaxID=1848329 RepID=A0A4R4WJX4_9ACTN|nr:DUF998 domain-containing protein [Nonomuraea diastatica]TDD19399.1 DUF998 domain-containing protein [Nonomuraea diastatica]
MTTRTLKALLGSGVAAGVLMPALLWADGATRPGYSLWHHGASQLGTGERAWLQTANLVAGGLLLLAFAAGLLEHLSLLSGFCWIIAVGIHLLRGHVPEHSSTAAGGQDSGSAAPQAR